MIMLLTVLIRPSSVREMLAILVIFLILFISLLIVVAIAFILKMIGMELLGMVQMGVEIPSIHYTYS